MPDLLRQEIAAAATTVVIKVGTRVLTRDDGTLDENCIARLAGSIAEIINGGRRAVVVSSGAVGAGIGRLNLSDRPADLAQLQAIAAVGQSQLTESYDRALKPHGLHAAQVLLTAEDLDDRTRYLNVRNTLLALFEFDAVPIINENDTTAVDELQISFGDNDRLAALVTNLLRAPLLVLLSDVDGLYDRPPHENGAQPVETVTDLDAAMAWVEAETGSGQWAGGGGQGSGDGGPGAGGGGSVASSQVPAGASQSPRPKLSKGGMASKLAAARIATASGENVIIASGRKPGALCRILAGEVEGTLILAHGPAVAARKRWILGTTRPRGRMSLDAGAARAVQDQGRSLLAVGLTSVQGDFQKGDVVALVDASGQEIARGLSNYSDSDVRRIAGRSTADFAAILGHCPHDEVVHRDNLAVVR